jgi:hypothetical protein
MVVFFLMLCLEESSSETESDDEEEQVEPKVTSPIPTPVGDEISGEDVVVTPDTTPDSVLTPPATPASAPPVEIVGGGVEAVTSTSQVEVSGEDIVLKPDTPSAPAETSDLSKSSGLQTPPLVEVDIKADSSDHVVPPPTEKDFGEPQSILSRTENQLSLQDQAKRRDGLRYV